MEKFNRNIYLSNMELGEAQTLFLNETEDYINNLDTEMVKVDESLGRITAKPVFAQLSSPHYNASAMDGIAVKSENTFTADERNPLRLKINEDFIYIDTGDVIKEPYNAVIMIEDVVKLDEETIEIIKPAYPWQHIRPMGEDIVENEMIVPALHRIRPVDIGALLSGRVLNIEVLSKIKVGIIATGTEIINAEDEIIEGRIIDSNSRMFENMVKEYGGDAKRYEPVIDDYDLIKEKIIQGAKENDIVVINAGSSAGREDYTSRIIADIGKLILHGVAIKPGKPAILGIVENKPIIGIPGYPVSAYFVFESFVKPLIFKKLNQQEHKVATVNAILSKRVVSSLKHLEFVRIKLGKVGEKLIATPLNRGAGVTMSLVKADGISRISKNIEGLEAGELIKVELLKNIETIENTIVSIGSHDIILDIIANMIHIQNPLSNLSSAHVGSLGGILALRKGECHIAPVHLLDDKSGTYNTEYIKKYLGNKEVSLIKGVKRIQGLMVKKGNPKNITSLNDLGREDIIFVNRQKGSGTRMLLDHKLKNLGIMSGNIKGYDREMTTHMTVASAIMSGTADTGIGIQSAANVMGLDFIPIGEEEYDFIIETKYLEDKKIQDFISILKSQEFKDELMKLGGYILDNTGKIINRCIDK